MGGFNWINECWIKFRAQEARGGAADENVIIPSIMQECYLNYSTIKRDGQSRPNTRARARVHVRISSLSDRPATYTRATCFPY